MISFRFLRPGLQISLNTRFLVMMNMPPTEQLLVKMLDGYPVGLFVQHELSPGVQLVKNSTTEVVWVKLDRVLFGLRSDLLLCLCYVTPPNLSFQVKVNFDILSQLL